MGRCEKLSTGTTGSIGSNHVEHWREGKQVDPPDTEIRALEYDTCGDEKA